MSWREQYKERLCSPEEAVKLVKGGDTVYIGALACVARTLTEALYARKDELQNVTIASGNNPWILPVYENGAPFSVLTFFAGPAERAAMKHDRCFYTSLHLSQIEDWCGQFLKDGVAFLDVSEPDINGYVSYGAYGPAMHDFVYRNCSRVVLQVNRKQPFVYGEEHVLHISKADAIIEVEEPLATVPDLPFDDTLRSMSDFIVDQIPDGATVQLGLGGVSAAVGFGLEKKNDLGIHTEMLTNSMMHLMEMGVITNKKKNFMPGKAVISFALGSEKLYEYIHRNEDLWFAPYSFVNDPAIIGKNDNMISVNTAMAVDLFGQVAADQIGGRQFSATGGQLDYVRGAQMSRGGKSFIALTSTMTNKDGSLSSRIMSVLPPATAITTPRQDVQYVVTEYGCVNLKRLAMKDRARALISLAAPQFRLQLLKEARQYGIL